MSSFLDADLIQQKQQEDNELQEELEKLYDPESIEADLRRLLARQWMSSIKDDLSPGIIIIQRSMPWLSQAQNRFEQRHAGKNAKSYHSQQMGRVLQELCRKYYWSDDTFQVEDVKADVKSAVAEDMEIMVLSYTIRYTIITREMLFSNNCGG